MRYGPTSHRGEDETDTCCKYFAPDYELDVRSSNMDNANSPEYLAKIRQSVIENLSRTKFAPSVQMQDIPPDLEGMDDEADAELDDMDEDENKDVRHTQRRWDKSIENDGELSESEDEDENERNGIMRSLGPRRRNMMDYQNPNAVDDEDDHRALEMEQSEANNASLSPPTANGANGMHNSTEPKEEDLSQNGDVEMDDEEVDAIPPESTPPRDAQQQSTEETVPVSTATADAAAAKDEGHAERINEDEKGEARAEAAE